jgi:hypothetical protein
MGREEDRDRFVIRDAVRDVVPGLRWGDGVVRESGLKLWPTSRPLVLALPFHGGRLSTTRLFEADIREEARGVGVGDGDVVLNRGVEGDRRCPGLVDARLNDDLLGVGPSGCGKPEYRFIFDPVARDTVLPDALLRLLGIFGIPLPPDMTTDDAGELSGVSIALRLAGLSIVTILDIESRNC